MEDNSSNGADAIQKKRARLSLSKTLGRKAKDSSDFKSNNDGFLDVQSSPPLTIKQIHSGNFESPTNHSFKLSKSLSQSPNKFIPRKSSNQSPSKVKPSNSPSKKLIKNSPIRYLKSKATYRKVSGVDTSHSPFKTLSFDSPEDGPSEDLQEISGYNHSTLDHINASNFCSILTDAILYLNEANIFNEEELNVVNAFLDMPWQNKELYIRMYGRKAGWHRVAKIQYNNISDNLSLVFKDLERAGFVTYDYSKEKFDTLLCLLQVAELKSLCKELKLKVPGKSNKCDLIKILCKFSTNQKTVNFGCISNKSTPLLNNSSNVLMKTLLKVLNDCISLSSVPLQIFGRMVLLFSLSRSASTKKREDVAQYLLLMHFVNIGKMAFPSYPVIRHGIFHSRDHLLSFEEARELENSLEEVIEQKDWNSIPKITNRAIASLKQILKDDTTNNHDQGLPLFLRKFTAGSTYSYLLTIAAEAMKRELSLVPNAIEILQILLGQKLYLTEHRGRWYEQLALLHQHKLSDNTEASRVVVSGLCDDLVTEVWRYTLLDRGTTLLGRKTKQPDKDAKQKLADVIDNEERLLDPSSIKIVARSLENRPGFKKVYVQVDFEKEETTYSSVEEFALSHYINSLGFVRGMHCEGAIIVSLFGLFFWDIIYELPITGAFQSAYQSEPLDLRSPEFYINRREAVDKRLEEMDQWNIDKIKMVVEQTFTEHKDKISVVNWDRLKTTSQVIDIVNCLSISVVTKICSRLVKHFRVAHSGFPDLIVWHPESGQCKFVEVKGKGDQLSVKQIVWLDYLKKIGADAEVCHVHHS